MAQRVDAGPAKNDHPGVIAPPPILFLIAAVVGSALEWFFPTGFLPQGASLIVRLIAGGLVAAAGVALALWAAGRFSAVGTNVEPWKPATAIAMDGPYRFTRNPMYVGLMCCALGLTVALDSLWMLAAAAGLFVALHFGVVLREERYLTAKFGEDYAALLAKTRRWL